MCEVFLLPITALDTARRKASGPPGPAVLQLSTCGVKAVDGSGIATCGGGVVA